MTGAQRPVPEVFDNEFAADIQKFKKRTLTY